MFKLIESTKRIGKFLCIGTKMIKRVESKII